MDILTLFTCCSTVATATSIRQMAIIAQAILTRTGRVTMLSISRWAGACGSYQTVNRFFATRLAWMALKVKFFQTHLFNPTAEYFAVGDETIVSKAGHSTHGLGRFYSGLKKQVIKGLSFFVFSLVNVNESESSPLAVKQMLKEEGEKTEPPQKRKKKRTAKRGRKRILPRTSNTRWKRLHKPAGSGLWLTN
jgi:putative transposase